MRILVPVDGSDASFRALDFGLDMAAAFDADVHVVHFSNQRTDATATILDRARDVVSASPLTDTPEVQLVDRDVWVDSDVGKIIVDFVDSEGFDHVVMGHDESGTVGRAILGSAAETVVRAESVPVTVVP